MEKDRWSTAGIEVHDIRQSQQQTHEAVVNGFAVTDGDPRPYKALEALLPEPIYWLAVASGDQFQRFPEPEKPVCENRSIAGAMSALI